LNQDTEQTEAWNTLLEAFVAHPAPVPFCTVSSLMSVSFSPTIAIAVWTLWSVMLVPLTEPSTVPYTEILNRNHFSFIVFLAPFRVKTTDKGVNPQNNSGHC
jgi:hypothetical protein